MILNVSGRTDIVAFYSEWFMNRYHEGYLDVRNPYYPKQVSRILFNQVEAIVFCTKNPIPILPYLKEIKQPILFQITLTPYKKDIEPNVIDKALIIDAIKKVSDVVGPENTYVRYDPIFISETYSVDYHIKAFERMCSLLEGYVNHIIVSFIDDYKNVRNNYNQLKIKPFHENDYEAIGKHFAQSAKVLKMSVQTCSEAIRLLEYGFIKQDCVPKEIAIQLTGRSNHKKWTARKNENCSCVEMVDIGTYNSCPHFCKYCYANYDETVVLNNMRLHNKNSSLLVGELNEDDTITIRK